MYGKDNHCGYHVCSRIDYIILNMKYELGKIEGVKSELR